jgi:hypothetical protein
MSRRSARPFADTDFGKQFKLDAFLTQLKSQSEGQNKGGAGAERASRSDSAEVAHWGFDPAPLHSLFGSCVGQLEAFSEELEERIGRAVEEGREAERAHKAKLGELETRLEQELILRIARLEEKANSFTETAVQIGDRLEKIHDTKQRATECGELMQHLDELQHHKPSNFQARRRSCRDSFNKTRRCACEDYHTSWSTFFRAPPFNNDVHAVARFVKGLRERALDLSSVLGSEAVRMRRSTEAYCEELDTHLTAEFFAATEHANYDTMQRCAETLEELSGLHPENPLITSYVHKRYTGWVKREDMKQQEPGQQVAPSTTDECEAQLTANFAKVLKFAAQESKVVQRVFPRPEKVMARLVERIFEDRIVGVYLREVFTAHEVQSDAHMYCVALAMAAQETASLAQQLDTIGTGDVSVPKLAVAAMATYAVHYWDREAAAIDRLLRAHLQPLDDESAPALKELRKQRGVTLDEAQQQLQQQNDSKLAAAASEVEQALAGVAAAVLRSAKMCSEGEDGAEERCENIERWCRDLVEMVRNHLDSVVSVAKVRAQERTGSSTHGQWHPLSAIRLITSVIQSLQQHHEQDIVARTAVDGESGRAMQMQCLARIEAVRKHIEEGVREVLELVLKGMAAECAAILRRGQRREDFALRPEDGAKTAHPTPACRDCVNFINAQHFFLQEHLEADNLHSFLGELGRELHRAVLQQLYTYSNSITLTGGRQLESDIVNYSACARSFNHVRVDQQFVVLREVARLYTAPAEAIPALLRGQSDMNPSDDQAAAGSGMGPQQQRRTAAAAAAERAGASAGTVLPNLPTSDLRQLLQLREDFKRNRLGRMLTDNS